MPDIGWMEIMVIAIVALIVAGPRDLLQMMRKAGQMTGKVRAMARDFQQAMNDAADEAGVGDIKRDMQSMSKYANPRKMGMDALNDTLDEIDPSKYEEGSETRKIAEEKAAYHKEQREAAEARRREREAATIARKEAAMAPPPQMGDATALDDLAPAASEAGDDVTPAIAPARSGTGDT